MVKKDYWVFVKQKAGNYKATRFLTKRAAQRYKNKFEEAYIKEFKKEEK